MDYKIVDIRMMMDKVQARYKKDFDRRTGWDKQEIRVRDSVFIDMELGGDKKIGNYSIKPFQFLERNKLEFKVQLGEEEEMVNGDRVTKDPT